MNFLRIEMNLFLKSCLTVLVVGLAGCAGTPPKLGLDDGQLKPCGTKPNCVSSQNSDDEHSIEAIKVDGAGMSVVGELTSLLKRLERVNIIQSNDRYVRAEFESRLFGFVDDVEFLIIEESPSLTVIHVRSGSRLGYSDLGVNRERIEMIRQMLTSN